MTTTPKRRFGFKRWIVLALIAAGVFFGFIAPGLGGNWGIFKAISPAVVIPGEPIWPGLPITNTVLATLIADLIILAFGFGAWRFHQSGQKVPSGLYNAFEALIEFLWNATEGTAGKWAKSIFPFVATIFLLVMAANLSKLVPGFEAIGYMKQAHANIQGYQPVKLFDLGGLPVYAIDGTKPMEPAEEAHAEEGDAHAAEGEAAHGEEDKSAYDCSKEGAACEVVPSLRGAATDLNFTFALAITAMVVVQIFGFRALGPGYLTKFFNVGGLISKPGFGVIDFGVGLLELISEFSKILSFSFRLFGNIFAGTLLLSILGTLTVVVLPVGLYLFELFFGTIQAYVFAMLALVFMSQATVSHHGDDHGEHH